MNVLGVTLRDDLKAADHVDTNFASSSRSLYAVAETWRRVWWGRKFFADQDFSMTFFSENISIFTAKISDDLFLVIDQVFRISPFFLSFPRFSVSSTMLNVVSWPFPHKYAAPTWWGLTSANDKKRLEQFKNKLTRIGYLQNNTISF